MQNYSTPKRHATSSTRTAKTSSHSQPSQKKQTKPRKRHVDNMLRFNICLSRDLVERVDAAAQQDYTTRSDMIRTALLWYLRPQGQAGKD